MMNEKGNKIVFNNKKSNVKRVQHNPVAKNLNKINKPSVQESKKRKPVKHRNKELFEEE